MHLVRPARARPRPQPPLPHLNDCRACPPLFLLPRYTVVVSKEGYQTLAANLTVPADGSGAQRHFLLAAEGAEGGGEITHSLRSLGKTAEGVAPDGAAAAALPWHGGRKGEPGGGAEDGGGEGGTRSRDRWLMLATGGVCVYGLWSTHLRLQRRSHTRRL